MNREIQQHKDGHDSKEDASAALDLIKLKLEVEHVEHVDDDNNFGFGDKYDDCGGDDDEGADEDDDDEEEEDDGNFSDMYDDACMLMKYGDVDDQYDYFLGDY